MDDDHSGDLVWHEFVAGCEDLVRKYASNSIKKAKSIAAMSFTDAKDAGPENVEDQIHKPVPSHLDRVVSKAALKPGSIEANESKEVEQAAREAEEQLKDEEEKERKAQEEHKKELEKQQKKMAEEKRQELLKENEKLEKLAKKRMWMTKQ